MNRSDWKLGMSSDALQAVWQWAVPCENAYKVLAEQFPEELVLLCKGSALRPAELTFAAEHLGNMDFDKYPLWRRDVINVLEDLIISYPHHPIVQEGALYGLNGADASADSFERVMPFIVSKTVKEIAERVLHRV